MRNPVLSTPRRIHNSVRPKTWDELIKHFLADADRSGALQCQRARPPSHSWGQEGAGADWDLLKPDRDPGLFITGSIHLVSPLLLVAGPSPRPSSTTPRDVLYGVFVAIQGPAHVHQGVKALLVFAWPAVPCANIDFVLIDPSSASPALDFRTYLLIRLPACSPAHYCQTVTQEVGAPCFLFHSSTADNHKQRETFACSFATPSCCGTCISYIINMQAQPC